MLFSTNESKRYEQAREILAVCRETNSERTSRYRSLRHIYSYGAHTGLECKDNRIKPIIDQLSSFIYTPETCNFWADIGPRAAAGWAEVPPQVLDALSSVTTIAQISDEKLEQLVEQINFDRIDSVTDSINDSWHDTDIDTLLGTSVTNALVDGSSVIMLNAERLHGADRNLIVAYDLPPEEFGVFDPGEPILARQQAVMHLAGITKPELLRKIAGHPYRTKILNSLEVMTPMGVASSRIFPTSATSTSVTGAPLGVFTGRYDYEPRGGAPRYVVAQLHCWDDRAGDWRVFVFSSDNVLWETLQGGVFSSEGHLLKRGMGIKGRLPYVKICPYPLRRYFFGYSLVDGLSPLQNWYSQRLNQLDIMFAKALSPPKAVLGMGGLDDEIKNALDTEGGVAFLGQPGAQIQEMATQVPPEALTILNNIQEMFYEFSSMRATLFGRQEKGTRTEGMLAGLLRVSAAATRKTALVVERDIEAVAQLLYLYKREFEDDELSAPDGNNFFLHEFPQDARIRVDGHSSSALFVQDNMAMAEALGRLGLAVPSKQIMLMNPPLKAALIHDLKKVEMARMVAAQVIKQQQNAKRSGKGQQAQAA